MKFIKNTLLFLLVAIAIVYIASYFFPTQAKLEQSTTINASRTQVFEYLRLFENQSKFNHWMMIDPEMKTEIIGFDGNKGSTMKWKSENSEVGTGEQQIKQLSADTISLDLKFIEPHQGTAEVVYAMEAIDLNQTKVTASFASESKKPMNVIFQLFFKKSLQKTLGENLSRLKTEVEKLPAEETTQAK